MRIQQHANRIMPTMTVLLAIAFAITATFILCGFKSDKPYAYEPVTETYIVQNGDILDNITSEYMKKNTYGKRGFDEFKQGIIELNNDKHPRIRYSEIFAGERLEIHYWIRKEVPVNE
ncbi:MAG: hypothetical protein K0R18_2001 [Bacillales bacterium]|nr:hypothetical protein [Bacillales bacterium]